MQVRAALFGLPGLTFLIHQMRVRRSLPSMPAEPPGIQTVLRHTPLRQKEREATF